MDFRRSDAFAAHYRHLPQLLACALLVGCARHGSPIDIERGGSHATLGVAGQLISGDDPTAIRSYLRSVKAVKPTRFEVRWSPDTVAVSKDQALRSLRRISPDGNDYEFAASEPVAHRLKKGSILWIWNIAVRRVERVETNDDTILVHTRPAALTEAFSAADIAFEAPVDLRNYYLSEHEPSGPIPQAPGLARNDGRPTARARFIHVAFPSAASGPLADSWAATGLGPIGDSASDNGAEPSSAHAPAGTEDAAPDESDADDTGVGTTVGNAYVGKLKGFDYSLGYQTRNNGLTVTLEARKSDVASSDDQAAQDTHKDISKAFEQALKDAAQAKKDIAAALSTLDDERKDLNALDSQYEREANSIRAVKAEIDMEAKTKEKLGRMGGKTSEEQLASLEKQSVQLQRALDKITAAYQRNRSTTVEAMMQVQQVRDAAVKRKAAADARARALALVGGFAKKLFDLASDNLDVRFRVVTDIDDFTVSGAIHIADGGLESAATQFKNLHGKVAVSVIGRLGRPGDGRVKVPLMNIPIVFNIPVPLGGIPFVIQVGSDFDITVLIAGLNATMQFDGKFDFSGSGGFHADRSGAQADDAVSGQDPQIETSKALTPGDSAFVLGVQAPRLGLGLGLLGASSVAYLDIVHVVTIENSAAFAMSSLTPPCRRATYTVIGKVGIDTKVMPLPIPFMDSVVNKTFSPKKEIFRKDKTLDFLPVETCPY